MEWKQHMISDQKAYRLTARTSIPSTQSVTLAPHLSRMISNKLSSIVYYMLSRLLYPLSRESPCGGDWRNVRSACRTQTGTLMSQSLTAEAQKSFAVVLPGGTALSEIISCIRQKEVISTAKKGQLLS